MLSQDRDLRDLRVLYEMRQKAELDAFSWKRDHIAQWLEDGEKLGLEKGEVSPARRSLLSSLSLKELDQLRIRLLRDRAWPIEP